MKRYLIVLFLVVIIVIIFGIIIKGTTDGEQINYRIMTYYEIPERIRPSIEELYSSFSRFESIRNYDIEVGDSISSIYHMGFDKTECYHIIIPANNEYIDEVAVSKSSSESNTYEIEYTSKNNLAEMDVGSRMKVIWFNSKVGVNLKKLSK